MQAERFATWRGHRVGLVSPVIAMFTVFCLTLAAVPAPAQTLERVTATGRIRLGYLVDARPFTYRTEAGTPEGYVVTLCQRVADQVASQLSGRNLTVEWVPVMFDNRLRDVRQGAIDVLCAPTSETLARRREVAFSIPIFGSGNRAVMRADGPRALRDALAGPPIVRPVWRGSPAAKVLQSTSFAVVSGTTTETWLQSRRATLQVGAVIVPVPEYRTGVQKVLDREVDVLFGERSAILQVMDSAARENLVILDRLFTHEPAALAIARGDEDFRLLVDRALSELYASEDFRELYAQWFGELDDNSRAFFLWNTLAE